MELLNPATGETIEEVREADAEAVRAARSRAREAQRQWARQPVGARVEVLERFGAALEARADELAAVQATETGKPRAHARAEIQATLPRVRFFVDNLAAATANEEVLDDGAMREVIVHEPLGVVANISAWNYPWFVGTNVYLPAIGCGNAVLYKPSEHATRCGLAVGELLAEAGAPEGIFTVLPGGGATGAALVDEDVDGVFFTGSHATGRRIAESVAPRMIRLQLELGGKDPAYVTDDVDVPAVAAALAEGAFFNNGQSCCAVERIYVHEAVHDEFLEHLVRIVEGFVVGDPHDPATDLGPIARAEQSAVLAAQVEDAVARGATVRTGGHALADRPGPPGAWWAPTVVAGATNGMRIMREESFGPVIGVAAVAGDDDALAAMDDTDYGLTAAVYCRDEPRALTLLAQLDVGSAYWNCSDRVSPRLPWTGRRGSGIGSTLSRHGILAFTRPKGYHLRRP